MALLDTLIIAGLVLVWGWVLGKPLVVRSLHRNQFNAFQRQLGVLSRGQRRGDDVARRRQRWAARRQAARRRQVFLSLVISVVVSLVLAVLVGDVFVTLHLTMDALFVGYIGLAVVTGHQRRQRRAKVVPLRRPGLSVEPAYARVAGEA